MRESWTFLAKHRLKCVTWNKFQKLVNKEGKVNLPSFISNWRDCSFKVIVVLISNQWLYLSKSDCYHTQITATLKQILDFEPQFFLDARICPSVRPSVRMYNEHTTKYYNSFTRKTYVVLLTFSLFDIVIIPFLRLSRFINVSFL